MELTFSNSEKAATLKNKELVGRLRDFKISADPAYPVHPAICDEAADKIEQFQTLYQAAMLVGEGNAIGIGSTPLRLQMLRSALEALSKNGG